MPKALKDGDKTVIISFSITPAMRAWYVKASADTGLTMSAIMRGATRMFHADEDPEKWKNCQ